jgi:uncharacterized membrane protein YGL010W
MAGLDPAIQGPQKKTLHEEGPFMLGNKSWNSWIAEYAMSHQHPVNQITHLFGIPMIAVSIPLILVSIFVPNLWPWAIGLFILGWILQFVGHAFEGKPPEFFKDWRFLFVGLRWWFAKILGKV